MTAVVPGWTLGDHMRRAMRFGGFTAGEMADYLDVTPQTVSTWLNGKNKPSKATLRVWAERTGVDYAWLCAARDSNPEPAGLALAA